MLMHNVPTHRVLVVLEDALDVDERGTARAIKELVERG
jgi:hypothetical protein